VFKLQSLKNQSDYQQVKIAFGKPEKIPINWTIKKLGSIIEVRGRIGWKGLTRSDYRDNGPIFLGVTNITSDFRLDLTEVTRITEERYIESPEIMLKPQDTLLAKSGATTGKVCFIESVREPTTVNAAVNILRCKSDEVYPKFLFYFLSWSKIQKRLFSLSSSGAQPNLFQRDTRNLKVILPTVKEQKKITSILSNIDSLIRINQKVSGYHSRGKKLKTKEDLVILKKGLMQKLLTGQIRVKV